MPSTLILPAAGLATRIGGIPKFLLPNRQGRALLVEHIASAGGIDRVVVVTRPDLQDFVRRIINQSIDVEVEVLAAVTATMSATVHTALATSPEITDFVVGLPDTVVVPTAQYNDLFQALVDSDIGIAAYPTRADQAGKLGALRLEGLRCKEVRDKDPSASDWPHHWGAIGFRRSVFDENSDPSDAHVGFALQRAVDGGADARVAHFGSEYFDLGTIDEFSRYYSPPSPSPGQH